MFSKIIVVARYNENIDWLCLLPTDSIYIYVYNKGIAIDKSSPLIRRPNIRIIEKVPNFGRESETYIRFIIENYNFLIAFKGTIVFTQGDPFTHMVRSNTSTSITSNEVSPFTRNHSLTDSSPFYGYSYFYLYNTLPPPVVVRNREHKYNVTGNRNSLIESASVYTFQPQEFIDRGILDLQRNYMAKHFLPEGTNLIHHFFQNVLKLPGYFAPTNQSFDFFYCGIFEVCASTLTKFSMHQYHLFQEASIEDPTHGYLFERSWYLLFSSSHQFHAKALTSEIQQSTPLSFWGSLFTPSN